MDARLQKNMRNIIYCRGIKNYFLAIPIMHILIFCQGISYPHVDTIDIVCAVDYT